MVLILACLIVNYGIQARQITPMLLQIQLRLIPLTNGMPTYLLIQPKQKVGEQVNIIFGMLILKLDIHLVSIAPPIYRMETPNGSDVVGMALGSTAAAFVGLSVVALTTRKDFSFMTGFLTVGMIALLGVVILSWVFDLSAFYGAIGGAVVLLMSGLILWQTSAIIHGGETNYVLATTTLYMAIYNMFSWLLLLIGMGDD